jgi:hypothetical protein
MEKKVLSESSIYIDEISEISQIDNHQIKNHILLNLLKDHSTNRYNDIQLTQHHQHITWVYEYLKDHFTLHEKYKTLALNEVIIQIHQQGQTGVKRNHINKYDIFNSPDFTFLYFLDTNSSELTIEWENYKHKNKFITIPLKEKKLIGWNSDLDYYLSPNENEEFRIVLLFNCKFI